MGYKRRIEVNKQQRWKCRKKLRRLAAAETNKNKAPVAKEESKAEQKPETNESTPAK